MSRSTSKPKLNIFLKSNLTRLSFFTVTCQAVSITSGGFPVDFRHVILDKRIEQKFELNLGLFSTSDRLHNIEYIILLYFKRNIEHQIERYRTNS